MDGGPCIRMENADDPRFALNADVLGIIPVLSESVDMAEENLKIVSIVGYKTLSKSQDSLNCCIIPLLGSSDELSDGSAHPGGLALQEATPIEGDGDSLKVNADDLGIIIIPVLSELCCDMSEENLKIVSIVGFGGIGKTTLAKSQHRHLPLQEATPIEGDGDSLKDPFKAMKSLLENILLLATLAATVTYQAGINPPGGFWSGTKSKHSSALHHVAEPSLEIYLGGYVSPFVEFLQEMERQFILGLVVNLVLGIALAACLGTIIIYFRLLLLAILVATLTYQAGMNPPEGFWSGTESEHSRIKGSNELKDVVRSQTLLSGTLAIALLFTLLDLFKAIGIPAKAKETGASKGYESTSMGSYTEYDPENSSGSDSMVAKDNAVAETVATWQVGSASTHHATGNRALLSDFITVDDLNILTGDGIIMPVSGRGSVITDTVVLHDVWFVPGLKKNVVSVSQLAELDCSIVFKRDACYISGATDGTIIGKALVGENGMFKLEFLKVPLVN